MEKINYKEIHDQILKIFSKYCKIRDKNNY